MIDGHEIGAGGSARQRLELDAEHVALGAGVEKGDLTAADAADRGKIEIAGADHAGDGGGAKGGEPRLPRLQIGDEIADGADRQAVQKIE